MPIDKLPKSPGVPTPDAFKSTQDSIQSAIDQMDPNDARRPTLLALQVAFADHRFEPEVVVTILKSIKKDASGETS